MASVDQELLTGLYVQQQKSIPQISLETGLPLSTIRFRLKRLGILRSRKESIGIAASQGRLGSGQRGTKRTFTEEWKQNISAARQKRSELTAKGHTLKPNGYVAFTKGVNKHRSKHVVTMEEHIGRRLRRDEVVHHIDHNRSNNDLSNLQLMTRSEHASLHAMENLTNRKRKSNGQFE